MMLYIHHSYHMMVYKWVDHIPCHAIQLRMHNSSWAHQQDIYMIHDHMMWDTHAIDMLDRSIHLHMYMCMVHYMYHHCNNQVDILVHYIWHHSNHYHMYMYYHLYLMMVGYMYHE